mmetsp:Transcript_561/g.1448  ORF Transcript_561/g.1448 Transcript_561/m.1448 type:complete len:272 (-) Transcript_561:298-1113(-)
MNLLLVVAADALGKGVCLALHQLQHRQLARRAPLLCTLVILAALAPTVDARVARREAHAEALEAARAVAAAARRPPTLARGVAAGLLIAHLVENRLGRRKEVELRHRLQRRRRGRAAAIGDASSRRRQHRRRRRQQPQRCRFARGRWLRVRPEPRLRREQRHRRSPRPRRRRQLLDGVGGEPVVDERRLIACPLQLPAKAANLRRRRARALRWRWQRLRRAVVEPRARHVEREAEDVLILAGELDRGGRVALQLARARARWQRLRQAAGPV